jgi:hypothetical protein
MAEQDAQTMSGRTADSSGHQRGDEPRKDVFSRFFSLGRGSNAAQWISAVCAIVTACAAVFAVRSYFHSLEAERARAAEESIARLYPMENEIERMLVRDNFYTPRFRRLFRDDEQGVLYAQLAADKDSEKDKGQYLHFVNLCALYGNLFEYYALVRNQVRFHPQGEEIIHAWDNFFKRLCRKSYGFRTYIMADPDVWTGSLYNLFKEYAGDLPYGDKGK